MSADVRLDADASLTEDVAFVAHVKALSDNNAVLTLVDEPAGGTDTAGAFADDTVDAQARTHTLDNRPGYRPGCHVAQRSARRYRQLRMGHCPSGIAFNIGTRVIS